MTNDSDRSDAGGLEVFFDAARTERVAPSDAFMAHLEAEARRYQARQRRPDAQGRAGRRVFADLLAVLGGWPGLAGLTAAACAGLWIGISPPEALLAGWQDPTLVQSVDPLSGYDLAMMGG